MQHKNVPARPGDVGRKAGHRLVIEYRSGRYRATCSCGEWETPPTTERSADFRATLARVAIEHAAHVEEARPD